jgi:dTMP kinase
MFIVFEGIDGAGKSSQIKRLTARLRQQKREVLAIKDPDSVALGMEVGRLVRDSNVRISPMAEMFLFQATHADLTERVIKPALADNKVVICDRFTASTVAYQGAGYGIEQPLIEQCNAFATGGLLPDVFILLDVDWDVSRQRISQPQLMKDINANDEQRTAKLTHIEKLPRYLQERIINSYRRQAQSEPTRWFVVDGMADGDQVERQIWAKLSPRLGL